MIVNKKRVYVKRNLSIDIDKIPLMTKIESLEDFKKAGVLKAQPFKYYCKQCGKLHVITSFNGDDHLIKTRYSRMLCRNCGRKAFNLEKYGAEEFAGLPEIEEKRKKTMLKHYGVDHPSKSKEIVNKIKKKFLEKYGTEWATSSKIVQDKVKATNRKRLGVDYPFQKDSVQVKVKDSFMKNWGYSNPACSPKWQEENRKRNIEKYGGPSPFSSKEVQEKGKKTNLERYGVENIMLDKNYSTMLADEREKRIGVRSTLLLPENIEKSKKTMLKNYGVIHPSKSKEIRKRIAKTNIKRYGFPNPVSSKLVKEKIKKTNLERYGVENYKQSLESRKRSHVSAYFKDGEHFDSLWELAVWIYCKDHNVPIEREPLQIEYDFDGKRHIYIPDFRINGKLIEIKGQIDFGFHDGIEKLKKKLEVAKENDVEIWEYDKVKPYIQYVTDAYGKRYFNCFKPFSLYSYLTDPAPIPYNPYQYYGYYQLINFYNFRRFRSYSMNDGAGVTPFDIKDDGSKYVEHPNDLGATPFDGRF